jgi:hypothetical protein
MFAVGMQVGGKDAGGIRRLQNHRAGAITEQDTGRAVAEIQNTRKHFRADDQRLVGSTRLDHGIGNRQRINEAAANRLDVECRTTGSAQLVLKDAGRGREHHVRRGGCHDDQVDLGGQYVGSFQGALGRFQGQVAARDVRGGEMPRADAGAFDDPVVAGFHALGCQFLDEVSIAQAPGWQITASAGDSRVASHGLSCVCGLA